MKFKKLFFTILFVFGLFTACNLGLGEEPDKEAPSISILSPQPNGYVGSSFEISGMCSDNKGVTKVEISNNKTGVVYGNATINGNEWSYTVNLEGEEQGEIIFLCKAFDKMGNQTSKSSKTICLFYDITPPDGLSWYVDRGNGIQVPLQPKEDLENLNTTISKNKDIPQNEKFTIHARFHDDMGITETTLILKETLEDNTVYTYEKTVPKVSVDEENMYSPEWTFTHEELVEKNPSWESGKHYLQISYRTKDENNNIGEGTKDYILWYPESDKPGISLIRLRSNGTMVETVKNKIPVEFFDDDELSEIYFALKSVESYNELLSADGKEKLKTDESFRNEFFTKKNNIEDCKSVDFGDGQRESNQEITAPETPVEMRFVAIAKDINGEWSEVYVNTQITDDSLPLLYINKPTENSTPNMNADGDTFSFEGYSLDTKGSSHIKIVFVPGEETSAAEKEIRAKELLNEYKSNTQEKIILESGEIIWYQKLGESGKESDWYKQNFEIVCDLMDDFRNNAKNDKFFEIYLEDVDGNAVYKQYRISGDTVKPTINIKNPEKDMWVCDYSKNDLTLKFKGEKRNGIGMDNSSYSIKYGDIEVKVGEGGITIDSEGNAVYTFEKSILKKWAEEDNNAQPSFTFYVKDILGNESSAKRTVVLSPLPTLQNISTGKSSGLYKKGDLIPIQVVFSSQVKVSGVPCLDLRYNESDPNPKYAKYVNGSGTDTLFFEFEIPEDAESEKLLCKGWKLEGDVLADESIIETAGNGVGNAHLDIPEGKNLQDSKTIKLDGVLPYIHDLSILTEKDTGSLDYLKADDEIKVIVTMNENVRLNGTPKIKLKSGNGEINCTFQSIDENKITFIHKVSALSSNGSVSCDLSKCFTELDTILDEAGNPCKMLESETKASEIVIDTHIPNPPKINIASGNYHENKELIISEIEEGAKVYYSSDGGLTYEEYIEPVTFGTGNYTFIAKQTDIAGNVSNLSEGVVVNIDADFPEVVGFTINKVDGNYKVGTEIPMKLSFADNVKVNDGDITLVMQNKDETKEVEISAKVSESTKSVEFLYEVKEGDDFKGIKITDIKIKETFCDIYGNICDISDVKSYIIDGVRNIRDEIIIDGVLPTINGFMPNKNSIVNNGNKIVLTFSEDVYKESGEIILKRTDGWFIPPVLDETEFYKVYNELSPEFQQKLLVTENGTVVTHSKTGQPIGPYRKITYGLEEGSLKPDIETKYVLDVNLGLDEGETTVDGYTFKVSEIREAFEEADYHRQILDVTSSKVKIEGNVVTIDYPETLVDGREWELIIPDTAFRDETGNMFEGIASQEYIFWSDKVAKPVIRVDRYSHGWGAEEPDSEGNILHTIENFGTSATTENSGATIKPTGYARVRIDCETPEVEIKYGQKGIVTREQDVSKQKTYVLSDYNPIPDCTYDEIINSTTTENEYPINGTNVFFSVGDGKLYTSRRDYVKAIATKTGFVDSDYGYEGVFKTVVIHREDNGKDVITIEGSTSAGGMPIISGYPLLDATLDDRYGKNAYNADDKKTWVWHSYEMVHDFTEMGRVGNYTKNYYSTGYGLLTFIYNVEWY